MNSITKTEIENIIADTQAHHTAAAVNVYISSAIRQHIQPAYNQIVRAYAAAIRHYHNDDDAAHNTPFNMSHITTPIAYLSDGDSGDAELNLADMTIQHFDTSLAQLNALPGETAHIRAIIARAAGMIEDAKQLVVQSHQMIASV